MVFNIPAHGFDGVPCIRRLINSTGLMTKVGFISECFGIAWNPTWSAMHTSNSIHRCTKQMMLLCRSVYVVVLLLDPVARTEVSFMMY